MLNNYNLYVQREAQSNNLSLEDSIELIQKWEIQRHKLNANLIIKKVFRKLYKSFLEAFQKLFESV